MSVRKPYGNGANPNWHFRNSTYRWAYASAGAVYSVNPQTGVRTEIQKSEIAMIKERRIKRTKVSISKMLTGLSKKELEEIKREFSTK